MGAGSGVQFCKFGGRPPPAHASQRLVEGDPREPGRELRLAAEGVELRERPHIGFLHDILGLGVVAHDRARHPEQPLVVALDERANGALAALPGQRDKLFIAVPAKLGLMSKASHLHVDVSLLRLMSRCTTPLAMISSTDGKPFSATSGKGVSPASGVAATESTAGGEPTTIRPTMPACSCGTQ